MQFWNIASVGEDSAELTLYGEIVTRRPYNWIIDAPDDGLWITPQEFLQELEAVKSKAKILIRINSVGGDLYTSLGIYTQLKDLPAAKTVVIDGIAASAASVIAMAGDTVQIPPGASIMIHEASMLLDGRFSHDDLKLVEKRMEAANNMAAQTYRAKTGLAVDAIRALMAKETWMTGQMAVDKKFADELIHGAAAPAMSLSADKARLTVNGVSFGVAGFRALPENIPVEKEKSTPPQAENEKGGEEKILKTAEDFKQAHPDLYAQVARDSRNEERERIRAIDGVAAAVGDAELLEAAKFGKNPMSAERLALEALKKQAAQGAKFLDAAAADHQASGAAGVKPTGAATGEPAGEGLPLSPLQRMAQGLADGKNIVNGGNKNA
ncbi:MAG: Clp protease ClpP [Oscillospiraceae bacterium]|jgi:ATP-dependent protease ClpP protease subunit|nr:Clp protease ClpP [Oscillospiraceae bacterium]